MHRPQLGMLAICVLTLGSAAFRAHHAWGIGLVAVAAMWVVWLMARGPASRRWWSLVIAGATLHWVVSLDHRRDHVESIEALAGHAVRLALAEGPLEEGRYWCSGWQPVEDLAIPGWVHSVVMAAYPLPDGGAWTVGTVWTDHGDYDFWAPDGAPYVAVENRDDGSDEDGMRAWLAVKQRDCPAQRGEGGS